MHEPHNRGTFNGLSVLEIVEKKMAMLLSTTTTKKSAPLLARRLLVSLGMVGYWGATMGSLDRREELATFISR